MKKRKKLLLILPIVLVLAANICLNMAPGSIGDDVKAKAESVDAAEEASAPDPSPVPSPTAKPSPSPSPSPTPDPETLLKAQGQQIADYALGYWGYKYKYGGESVEEGGFDCSGLVYHCYEKFGYRLQRVAAEQAKQGVEIAEGEELWPGDVLCFYTSGKYVGHVGIYVGNNCYIHAMGEAYGVVVTPLDHPDLQREFTARRFVGCEELMIPQSVPAA